MRKQFQMRKHNSLIYIKKYNMRKQSPLSSLAITSLTNK